MNKFIVQHKHFVIQTFFDLIDDSISILPKYKILLLRVYYKSYLVQNVSHDFIRFDLPRF